MVLLTLLGLRVAAAQYMVSSGHHMHSISVCLNKRAEGRLVRLGNGFPSIDQEPFFSIFVRERTLLLLFIIQT